ncbi:MAG: malic enzyme-like NAD(P)-binding protein, partial [Thermodesulforhabdaceae bacterium]
MFFVAARTLAEMVDRADLDKGRVYPPLTRIREVSFRIAVAVADVAYRRGLANMSRPDDLEGYISSLMYYPDYESYV